MLESIATKAAHYLAAEDNKEQVLVQYSIQMLLGRALVEVTVLLTALLTHQWAQTIIVLFSVNYFRKHLEGWHSSHFFVCYCCSLTGVATIMLLGNILSKQGGMVTISLCITCLLIVLLLAHVWPTIKLSKWLIVLALGTCAQVAGVPYVQLLMIYGCLTFLLVSVMFLMPKIHN